MYRRLYCSLEVVLWSSGRLVVRSQRRSVAAQVGRRSQVVAKVAREGGRSSGAHIQEAAKAYTQISRHRIRDQRRATSLRDTVLYCTYSLASPRPPGGGGGEFGVLPVFLFGRPIQNTRHFILESFVYGRRPFVSRFCGAKIL